jgi:hypothetical protein
VIDSLARMVERGPLRSTAQAMVWTMLLWACEALFAGLGVWIGIRNGATDVGELLYAALVSPFMIGGLILWPLEAIFETLGIPTTGSQFGVIAVPILFGAGASYWITLLWLSWRSARHRSPEGTSAPRRSSSRRHRC